MQRGFARAAAFLVLLAAAAGAGRVAADLGTAADDRLAGWRPGRCLPAPFQPEVVQSDHGGRYRVHPVFGAVVLVDESQTLARAEAHERREPVGVAHHQRGPGLPGQLRAEQEALAPFCRAPHGRAPVDGLESLRVVCKLLHHLVVEAHYQLHDPVGLVQALEARFRLALVHIPHPGKPL